MTAVETETRKEKVPLEYTGGKEAGEADRVDTVAKVLKALDYRSQIQPRRSLKLVSNILEIIVHLSATTAFARQQTMPASVLGKVVFLAYVFEMQRPKVWIPWL